MLNFIGEGVSETYSTIRLLASWHTHSIITTVMGCTSSDLATAAHGDLEPELEHELAWMERVHPSEEKPEENLFEAKEVTEEQFMATKPWIGALKPPSEVPTIDASPPTTNLTLKFVNGYKVEDARNVVFFGSNSSTIIYPAAAVGIVMDTNTLKQQFMGAGNTKTAKGHTDDITCLAVNKDRSLAVTGSLGKQPLLLVWSTSTMEVKARTNLSRNTMAVSTVKFSADGKYIFCTDKSTSANVYCYNAADLKLVAQEKLGEPIIETAVGNDNTLGVATSQGVWFFKFE